LDRQSRLVRWYKSAALLLLNFLVFLVVANVALYVLFRVKDARTARHNAQEITRIHENSSLRAVYPGMDAEAISQLIHETWSRPYAYEPFTQFKERPFHGRFVNVSEDGFRVSKDQGPWPPDPGNYNVFLFGGSTTFGYGVPDDQTVASYLQDDLRRATSATVCVYNFGRSSYVLEQERVLFEELLLAGTVPDLALFIDGLNEFAFPFGPAETQRLQAVFDSKPDALDRWGWLESLPMTRFAHFSRRVAVSAASHRRRSDPRNTEPTAAFDDGKYHDPEVIAGVIARYLNNKRFTEVVAREYGTRAVFVWQPIPLYKYDLHHHLFATSDFGSNFFARYGYRYMADRMDEASVQGNFLWCADIQENLAEPLYVDKVHYTARMSALVASTISDGLVGHGLLQAPAESHASAP
jgi:hypothetical protein